MGRFCTACGAPARDEGAFCQQCGARLQVSPGGSPGESTPPPSARVGAPSSKRRALIAGAIVLAVAAAAAIVLLGNGVPGGVEGTYTLTEWGNWLSGEADPDEYSLTLRDGAFTMKYKSTGGSFTSKGTYSVEGDEIALLSEDGGRETGKVEGDQIMLGGQWGMVWTKR